MTGHSAGEQPAVLVLSNEVRQEILRHLEAALPNEGVGLLAVEWIEQRLRRIAVTQAFYPGTNFRASPTRFELDRLELIAALKDMDRRNWALGAIVHSHPAGPATPSRTDLAEANYPESLMLIASFATATPDLQAWELVADGDAFAPQKVTIIDRLPVRPSQENCR